MKKPEIKRMNKIRTHIVLSSADIYADSHKGSAHRITFVLNRKQKLIQKGGFIVNKCDYREY